MAFTMKPLQPVSDHKQRILHPMLQLSKGRIDMHRNYTQLCGLGFLLAFSAICYLAFSPKPLPSIDLPNDKINHLLAFSTLYILLDHYLEGVKSSRIPSSRIVLFLVIYGLIIEIVQSQIPNRHGSLLDILADMIGIFLGGVLSPHLKKVARKLF